MIPTNSDKKTPTFPVSLVIVGKNEEENLEHCLEGVIRYAPEGTRIIFVDDGSTDQTFEIAKKFNSKIEILRGVGEGPGKARNLALQRVQSPYVAFLDADAAPYKPWLELLHEQIADSPEDYAGVGGGQISFPNACDAEKRNSKFLESISLVSDYIHVSSLATEVKHNPSCNVLYRTQALQSVSGFDETLWPTEDLDLDYRLRRKGYRFLFHPNADVFHRRPSSLFSLFRMMQRYGFAHRHFVKKNGPVHIYHALPWLIPALYVSLLTFGIFSRYGAVLVVILGYVLLSFFFYVRKVSVMDAFVFPWILLVVIHSWILGYFQGMFSRRGVSSQT